MLKLISVFIALVALPLAALDFSNAWVEEKFPLKADNDFALNGGSVDIVSHDSVSVLYRPVYGQFRSAKWQWSVSQSVPATNLRNKGGDDRNIAIYFLFMPEAEAAASRGQGLLKILRNPSAKALIYSYGGQEGRGASYQSPYGQGRALQIILAPAGEGSGAENVDFVGDFQHGFGEQVGVLVGVGISADSDDTNSEIRARLSGLELR